MCCGCVFPPGYIHQCNQRHLRTVERCATQKMLPVSLRHREYQEATSSLAETGETICTRVGERVVSRELSFQEFPLALGSPPCAASFLCAYYLKRPLSGKGGVKHLCMHPLTQCLKVSWRQIERLAEPWGKLAEKGLCIAVHTLLVEAVCGKVEHMRCASDRLIPEAWQQFNQHLLP